MRLSPAAAVLAAAVLLAVLGCSRAADIVVGGSGGWNNDQAYPAISANSGDVLVGQTRLL